MMEGSGLNPELSIEKPNSAACSGPAVPHGRGNRKVSTVRPLQRGQMTTTWVEPTETQLQLVSSQHFDTWRKQGQGLFHHLQATENALELSQWKIGDWLIEGDDTFGEKAYQAAKQITGWTKETLY